ncbi:MAG: MBL fold metallo-hydrolase, partial [Fidelibacterota bacterium]
TKTVNMQSSLRKFGYAAEDVTDVFCTHLHFDHAGGNTRIDEAGRVVPTFPNATYWVQKSNWELANAPSEKDRASYLSENWAVLAENGMIQLVEGEEEFIPGLEVIVTNGHTAGQQLPKISHGNHTILFAGDLFPTVAHLRIPWVMAYDNFPVQTLAEKKALLPRMVRENWILFLEHDSRHVAVTVEHDGKNYRPKETITIS